MSEWSVEFSSEADKDFSDLDNSVQKRIVEKLNWLENNFNEVSPVILTADFRDYFKLRVGDWRVFYQVNWYMNIISIRYIDHRSKAYKKSKR